MKNKFQFKQILLVKVLAILCFGSFLLYPNFEDNDYQLAIEERRYSDALKILNDKSEKKRTVPEKELIESLDIVISIQNLKWPKNSIASPEDEVDPEVVKQVNRYMNAGYQNFLNNRKGISQKLLLQVLFIYPDYPKARAFLSTGYSLPSGSYSVRDQVIKLLKRSDNYFYGGNYLKSADDLEVLVILERDNPIVYEKLGSAYYMMNLKQKAIDTWTTALFFNPDNAQLEELINITREALIKEAEAGNPLDQATANKVEIEDPQVMGVFKRQSEAFTLMKDLRAQGLTVGIEENDEGRWVVQVSRKELQEKNAQKGSE